LVKHFGCDHNASVVAIIPGFEVAMLRFLLRLPGLPIGSGSDDTR
jgi:hypothetical protein